MNHMYNKSLSGNARALRREMTPEEKHLWYDFLKRLPMTVHRQKVIGTYIVDFYIAESRTVIEIDGLQHTTPEHRERDAARDATLTSLGISVLRYKNEDVHKSFEGVQRDILAHIGLSFQDLI